jgi:hypothetical protein
MNFDIAIHRLALSQSRTLGGAQLLVAKLRNDVELEQLRDRGTTPDRPLTRNDGIAAAFKTVAEGTRPLAVSTDAAHLIDKLA